MDDAQLGDILVEEHYVAAEDLARRPADVGLTSYLISEGLITKPLMGQAIAEHFGVKYLDLAKAKYDDALFAQLPEIVATSQRGVIVNRSAKGVRLALEDPANIEFISAVEKKIGERVIAHYALPADIESALTRYKADIRASFQAIFNRLDDGDVSSEQRDMVVSDVVDLIVDAGHRNGTSDIHLEPDRKQVLVRFRIDGVLHDVLELEPVFYLSVLSRIKILSKMRTDQHRAAQDGKFRFTAEDKSTIDVRVSVVPTNNSENVVMRLLSSKSRQFGLSDLGFDNDDMKKMEEAIANPHGMILVTGPTGSGKTTSLYAVMKILNKREVHVATIEDPVEYDMEGVTQIQVNNKANLTFASGLRSIVRQDPDIIMVGEIRDEETAGIAVNSALTGHLVLSTLNTNDAATALPRLLDMKVEPFLVASTVNIIIAQRLLRKICNTCIESYTPEEKQRTLLLSDPLRVKALEDAGYADVSKLRLYRGAGCKVCHNSGYVGRIGVFEVLPVTDEIRRMIMDNANADDITKKAIEDGMSTMMQDGVKKAVAGLTTLEEVFRVTM